MADEGNIISNLNLDPQGGPAVNGEDTSPAIGFISQYVKDLSVESPNAPDSLQWVDTPEMTVDFNIAARSMGPDVHEIELKIKANSKTSQGTAFIVELAFAGLIAMRNIPDEQAHPFLFAEAPRLLFPFARRIIADAVRDAGFPPLILEPIDFNGLYFAQIQQQQADAVAASVANPLGEA
jgi:preprotein translocase subunit SecB